MSLSVTFQKELLPPNFLVQLMMTSSRSRVSYLDGRPTIHSVVIVSQGLDDASAYDTLC